jgi:hypothetical protein
MSDAIDSVSKSAQTYYASTIRQKMAANSNPFSFLDTTTPEESKANSIGSFFNSAMALVRPFALDAMRPKEASYNIPDSVRNDPRVQNLLGSYGFPDNMPSFNKGNVIQRNAPYVFDILQGLGQQLLGGNTTSSIPQVSQTSTVAQSQAAQPLSLPAAKAQYDSTGVFEINDLPGITGNIEIPKLDIKTLDRIKQYDPLVEQAASEYGVPSNVLRAVMIAESNGDPNAVSKKGALGLMQLIPSAWKDKGPLEGIDDPEQLKDPLTNIRGGAYFLSKVAQEFDGDYAKAIAAYNTGGPKLKAQLAAGTLNAETAAYVPKVQQLTKQLNAIYPSKG